MRKDSVTGVKRHALAIFLCAALVVLFPGSPAAQALPSARPWTPSAADSTRIWLTEALALLEASTTQQLDDDNLRAFQLLDRVAINYFHKLGPRGMAAAEGLHTALDTLGLRAEISQDTELPAFTLVNFLNPVSDKFASLAFLYWFRGDELRSQPLNLSNGREVRFRVFWIGAQDTPYEAALIHHEGDGKRRSPVISTMRLSPNADVWFPRQMASQAIRLDGAGEAVWADVNNNGLPEIVSWTERHPGPPFEFCDAANCPHLIVQSIFARTPNGRFTRIEEREIPLPVRSLVHFVQAIRDGDEAAAREWIDNDGVLRAAGQLEWGKIEGEGTFKILRDRGESREEQRIRVAYQIPGAEFEAAEAYFVNRDGRWLIGGIVPLGSSAQTGTRGNPE